MTGPEGLSEEVIRARMAEVHAAVARFEAGDSDVEILDNPRGGPRTRLRRDPGDRFRHFVEVEDEEDGEEWRLIIRAQHIAAWDDGPLDYPNGFPFLPGLDAMVLRSALDDSVAVRWEGDETGAILEEIERRYRAAGWEVDEEEPGGVRAVRIHFRNDGEERRLFAREGTVLLQAGRVTGLP